MAASFMPNELEVLPASNVSPGTLSTRELEQAATAAEERIAAGFDAYGRPGGEFSKCWPPPGTFFGGYHKGATGVNWIQAKSAPNSDDAQQSGVLLSIGLDAEQVWSSILWHKFRVATQRATVWELFEDAREIVRAEAEATRAILRLGTTDGWAWRHLTCSLHTSISLLPGPLAERMPDRESELFCCVSPSEERCTTPLNELRASVRRPCWRGGGSTTRPLRDGDLVLLCVHRD